MSHEIELYGCLTIPDDANFDEITDVFLGFMESQTCFWVLWNHMVGIMVVGSLRFEMAVM